MSIDKIYSFQTLKSYKIMPKVKVTQVKSMIDRPENQKRTLFALGLGKIGRSSEKETNSAIDGMIRKVLHLVKVEAI